MVKGIIEDDEVHLLGSILLIVSSKFLVAFSSDGLNVWACLIHVWSNFSNITVLIDDILSLEVAEEIIGHQLLILESETISEFFFGDTVKHVLESLLVLVVDEFINEGSLALVSPQSDQEQLWPDLLLDIKAVLNDFEVRLGPHIDRSLLSSARHKGF